MLPLSDQRPAVSTMTEAANLPAFMDHDMSAQADWLGQHARSRGFADLDELLGNAPAVFTQLASMWRQMHPLPQMAQ
jgi:hypothetical protein